MLVSWIELPQSEIHPLSNWRERENRDEIDLYSNNCCGVHTTTNVMFLSRRTGQGFKADPR